MAFHVYQSSGDYYNDSEQDKGHETYDMARNIAPGCPKMHETVGIPGLLAKWLAKKRIRDSRINNIFK